MKKVTLIWLLSIMTSFTFGQFATVTYLTPLNISSHTGQKPQAKTWFYSGYWWAALATSNGTQILRLDVPTKTWTSILKLSGSSNSKCDVRVVGDVVHILLFRGASSNSNLASAQYDPATNTYKFWSKRLALANIKFETGTETATLDMDSKGTMWIASDGDKDIRVRWSLSPYNTWNGPIILATGITSDDICSITALKDGKIGVFWGNQNTQRFGFRTHTDGTAPDAKFWSRDENPAWRSALSVGHGFTDDHLQLMLASNGTLYVAMKTSYDTPGYTKIGLLVRRPGARPGVDTATWDNMYPVTTNMVGTRPMAILNESIGKIKVLYTSLEGGGDIRYKEALISNLNNFSKEFTLFKGNYNYLTSTHQTYNPNIAVIVTDQSSSQLKAAGFLGSDVAGPIGARMASSASSTQSAVSDKGLTVETAKSDLEIYPNPFTGTAATITYTPKETGPYSIGLYDIKGTQILAIKHGWAEGGKTQKVQLGKSNLNNGVYLLRLETNSGTKTVRLVFSK